MPDRERLIEAALRDLMSAARPYLEPGGYPYGNQEMANARDALAADREPEPVQITDEMARELIRHLGENYTLVQFTDTWRGLGELAQILAARAWLTLALSEPPPEGEKP